MQNIASYTSLTFSINFDKFIKQAKYLPYMIGTTQNSLTITPITTLSYTDNLDIKRFVKTSPPYYIDKLDTSYTGTNLNFNYIFINFSLNVADKYVPYGGYYFKNSLTGTDDVLDDNFNGIGYYARAPDVKFEFFLLLIFGCLIIR